MVSCPKALALTAKQVVEIGVCLVKAFWKWVGRCAMRYGKGLKSMVSFPKACELRVCQMVEVAVGWANAFGDGKTDV